MSCGRRSLPTSPASPVEVVTVSGIANEPSAVRQALATMPAIPYTVPDRGQGSSADNGGPQLTPPQELTFTERDRPLAMAPVTQEQEPDLARQSGSTLEEDLAPESGRRPNRAARSRKTRPHRSRNRSRNAPQRRSRSRNRCRNLRPKLPRPLPAIAIYNERDCCKDEQRLWHGSAALAA